MEDEEEVSWVDTPQYCDYHQKDEPLEERITHCQYCGGQNH